MHQTPARPRCERVAQSDNPGSNLSPAQRANACTPVATVAGRFSSAGKSVHCPKSSSRALPIAHLGVHGNCNYDFRMADGSSFAVSQKANKAQRPENQRMQELLRANGIDATPKYIPDGSMRGCWRIYNHALQWTDELRQKLTALGFVDFDNQPLGQFSDNGGMFSVFVRGHNELLQG